MSLTPIGEPRRKITTTTLREKKLHREPISCLTAYDYAGARLVDEAGIDIVLVGDSLAMTMLGYENTLSVTVDEMLHHVRAVRLGGADADREPLGDLFVLEALADQTAGGTTPVLTTQQGIPVANDQNSLKIGMRGPTALEDFHLREKLFHFDHERIPERVVHARGFGAHGNEAPRPFQSPGK